MAARSERETTAGRSQALSATQRGHRLGALSERYESGGRGPGTVSSGRGDPGGVSYGLYQLASRAGTVAAFLAAEGAIWADDFAGKVAGSPAFTAAWQAVAARVGEAFGAAQHAFIARTHYRPAVLAVLAGTGFNADGRSDAVRDVCWSCAVQHGAAARLIEQAVRRVDATTSRADPAYDRLLIGAIYAVRTDYVRAVAARLPAGQRQSLEAIADHRYPAERAAALAMLVGQ